MVITIAVSADKIVAHPTTVTGSIGVIMLKYQHRGTFAKGRRKDTSIKSGDRDASSTIKNNVRGKNGRYFKVYWIICMKRFLGVIAEAKEGINSRKTQIRLPMAGFILPSRRALERIFGWELAVKSAGHLPYHRPRTYKLLVTHNSPVLKLWRY